MDEFELRKEPIEPPPTPTPRAESEAAQFGARPPEENSIVIRLWKDGHVSFNPRSHTPIFASFALILVLLASLLLAVIGIWVSDKAVWIDKIATALGYGVTGIIGAMVGSASTSKEKDKP